MIQSISFAFLLLPTASPHFTPAPQHQPFFALFCLCYSRLLTEDFLSWATLAKLAAVWVWLREALAEEVGQSVSSQSPSGLTKHLCQQLPPS